MKSTGKRDESEKKLILGFRLVLESEDRRTKRRKMEFSGAGTYGMSIIVAILSAFVLSGEGPLADLESSGVQPTWVFDDIAALHRALREGEEYGQHR